MRRRPRPTRGLSRQKKRVNLWVYFLTFYFEVSFKYIYVHTAEFRLFFLQQQVLNLFCPFLLHLRASDSKGSKSGNGGISPCIPNFGIWWKLVVIFTLLPLSCTENTPPPPSCFPKNRLDKPASPVWAAEVTNKFLAAAESRSVILRWPIHILNISLCHLSYDRTL